MLERSTLPDPDLTPLDWRETDPTSLLKQIELAGIVGMGGAGFPAHLKLKAGLRQGVKTVIANGVECEPGANADRALLDHYLSEVLIGLHIVGQITACNNLFLVLSREAGEVAATGDTASRHKTIYVKPSPGNGEERILISTILDVQVPDDQHPTDYGIVVFNVATLFAICEAVRDGRTPKERVVSVFGEPRWVRVGTEIRSLAEFGGNLKKGTAATGRDVTEEEVVGLTQYALSYGTQTVPRACIHCGWCNQVCPKRLDVEGMHRHVQTGSDATPNALARQFDECFECGACVVECPSNIPLLESIRDGRHRVTAQRTRLLADLRFRRRVERLEAQAQHQEAARTERMQVKHTW